MQTGKGLIISVAKVSEVMGRALGGASHPQCAMNLGARASCRSGCRRTSSDVQAGPEALGITRGSGFSIHWAECQPTDAVSVLG